MYVPDASGRIAGKSSSRRSVSTRACSWSSEQEVLRPGPAYLVLLEGILLNPLGSMAMTWCVSTIAILRNLSSTEPFAISAGPTRA